MSERDAREYKAEDIARLKQLIKEGVAVLQEVDDLKSGLRDTVKAIAEEIDVPSGTLNKVINTVFKKSLRKQKESFDLLEDLLGAAGYEATDE